MYSVDTQYSNNTKNTGAITGVYVSYQNTGRYTDTRFPAFFRGKGFCETTTTTTTLMIQYSTVQYEGRGKETAHPQQHSSIHYSSLLVFTDNERKATSTICVIIMCLYPQPPYATVTHTTGRQYAFLSYLPYPTLPYRSGTRITDHGS